MRLKRLIPLVIAATAPALALAGPALAGQPPGHQQQGYEGQPGNQSSGGN